MHVEVDREEPTRTYRRGGRAVGVCVFICTGNKEKRKKKEIQMDFFAIISKRMNKKTQRTFKSVCVCVYVPVKLIYF